MAGVEVGLGWASGAAGLGSAPGGSRVSSAGLGCVFILSLIRCSTCGALGLLLWLRWDQVWVVFVHI